MTFHRVKNIGLTLMVCIMILVSLMTHFAMRPVSETNITNLQNIAILQHAIDTYSKFQQASLLFERLTQTETTNFSEPKLLLQQITQELRTQTRELALLSSEGKELLHNLEQNARIFHYAVSNYELELIADPTSDNITQLAQVAQQTQKKFSVAYNQVIAMIRQKDHSLHNKILDSMRKSHKISMFGLIFLICSSIVIAISLSRALSRPLKHLIAGTKQLAKGNLDFHFANISDDEIGTLQRSFNNMATSLRQTMVSKDLLDDIIHSMVDSLIVVNTNGTIQLANDPTVTMLGYESLDELILNDFSHILCQDNPEAMACTDLLQAQTIKTKEFNYLSKSGSRVPVLFSSSILRNPQGEITGLICLAKDDTERRDTLQKQKLLEEELHQTKKLEAIGTLAGGIAHDFNNLLSVIVGYAELTKHELPTDSPCLQNIDEILRASRRAANLVRQILSFSRKSQHELQTFAPHIIIKEALKMLRSSLPSTVEVVQEIDPQCGNIHADPSKLHQVIMNLCTNGFQSIGDQKGTLTITLKRREIQADKTAGNIPPGTFIVISIRDTGCGMDKATLEQIFNPFFTTKEVGKGTGLGLAVIHGIIKDYKGFIQVESEPQKGTTFNIYIPPTNNPISDIQEDNTEELPTGTEHILVVDDEQAITSMHKAVLESLFYEVTVMNDSREALETIQSNPKSFDLLITDQTMPDLPGAELAKAILKIRPSLPIILCSGYSSVISEEDALAIGIRKYAKKPVARAQLAKIVRVVLDDPKNQVASA